MFAKLRNFFIESRQELRQVRWPTRREGVYLSLVVIIASAVLAGFLGGLDYVFSYFLRLFVVH